MKHYLTTNTLAAMRTSPLKAPLQSWILLPLYGLLSAIIGFNTGLLELELLQSAWALLLPFTLFIFPALLEEFVFRGVMIPRNILSRGWPHAALWITLSTVLFVIWHPLNAYLFNHSAIPIFFDPFFLSIVTLLGITCGYSYVVSKCLWVPVIIHWITVVLWVIFFGGRNLILEV